MNIPAARRLARNLMIRHGVPLWSLNFMNHRHYAGICRHKEQVISLSVEFVQAYTVEQVTQLVLHEIAHARRGRCDEDGHDKKWLKIARRLGYTGEATLPASYPTPQIVWDIVCTSTGLIQQTNVKPDPKTCNLCKTPECTPEVQRRQIVKAHIHNRPAPPHIFAPVINRLKKLFDIGVH